jgi:TonB family protein
MQSARLSKIALLALFVIAVRVTPIGGQSSSTPPTSTNTPPAKDDKAPPAGSAHVGMPACTYMPNPPYTQDAKDSKIEGSVLVSGIVGLDGKITNMRVIKALGHGLDESALDALKKWKCTPAKGTQGKPVPTIVTFQINFRLRKGL